MNRMDILNYPTIDRMITSLNRKWLIYPQDVIPMWLASPDFPILPEIKQSLHDAVDAEDLYYNLDIKPRTAMAEKIRRANRIDVTSEDIMIVQGVEPILWFAVKHACIEGDEVILPNPMYSGFLHAVEDIKAKPVYWDLDFDKGYRFDMEKFKELVSKKTKLICLCNPHNPASKIMTRAELKAIADIAVDNKIRVFVDELWEDIRFDGREHVSLASLNPEIESLTATAWGVSKTFGVAGLYLGYLATTNKEMLSEYRKIAGLVQRGSSTLAKAVAPLMLDESLDWWRRDLNIHLMKIRDLCYERMNNIPNVTFPVMEGTYMAFPRFDLGMKCDELHEFLLSKAKVALSKGTGFGPLGQYHMRMCLATSEAIVNEAIDRLEDAINRCK